MAEEGERATVAKRAVSTVQRNDIARWPGESPIAPGETRNVTLAVSESYSGMTLRIPLQIRRGPKPGPAVFVTAAIHGDEVNGTGAIRHLIQSGELQLRRGSLMLVPVVNILAFDRHSRYLPDRRDLNRCFPGRPDGSLASRMARRIFDEIVGRCDMGIDLHTAAVRRTNYPTVRGDMRDPTIATIARAFGTEFVLDSRGAAGTLRREATRAGCPTIVVEAGEVWKVEPTILEVSVNGICNVLRALEMLEGTPAVPDHQLVLKETKWVRAQRGGFLQFHVKPGEIVRKKQLLATITTLLGEERSVLEAPFSGVIIGMTTLPAISPGEPVCNVGKLPRGIKPATLRRHRHQDPQVEQRVVQDLASNVVVVEPSDRPAGNEPPAG
ncbi:MAG: succinate dehydrogenase [Pirellulaceae bacterium]|nr:MAG: succinate dehydrogenase [Pirellulaceae bacterium]